MKNNNKELRPAYIHEANYDDEISLIDLMLFLISHKVMISTIFMLFIVSGTVFAFLTPKTYTFSTSIDIGSQVINGSIKSFEPAKALLAKLKYNHIPLVLSQQKHSFPDDKFKYKIESSVPDGSNIVLLEIKGIEDKSDTLIGLLEKTSQKAIQDHNRNIPVCKEQS